MQVLMRMFYKIRIFRTVLKILMNFSRRYSERIPLRDGEMVAVTEMHADVGPVLGRHPDLSRPTEIQPDSKHQDVATIAATEKTVAPAHPSLIR